MIHLNTINNLKTYFKNYKKQEFKEYLKLTLASGLVSVASIATSIAYFNWFNSLHHISLIYFLPLVLTTIAASVIPTLSSVLSVLSFFHTLLIKFDIHSIGSFYLKKQLLKTKEEYINIQEVLNLILATSLCVLDSDMIVLDDIKLIENKLKYNLALLEKEKLDSVPEAIKEKFEKNIKYIQQKMSKTLYNIQSKNLDINPDFVRLLENVSIEEKISLLLIKEKQHKEREESQLTCSKLSFMVKQNDEKRLKIEMMDREIQEKMNKESFIISSQLDKVKVNAKKSEVKSLSLSL